MRPVMNKPVSLYKGGASVETRTRDLLFTKQLLYQLSYAGNQDKV